MSFPGERDPMVALLRHELDVLQGNWLWYLALGIALVVLGTAALGAAFLATLTIVAFLGVLLIVAGTTQTFGAFLARRWSGFLALLLTGVLYLLVGVLMVEHPAEFAAGLTLVIALFLMVGGLFRILAAMTIRFPHWGWLLANGVITLALGILIWRQWPGSAHWVIGLFVGIELIFNGWTWILFALAIRSLPRGGQSLPG